jgi:hypothetical protein
MRTVNRYRISLFEAVLDNGMIAVFALAAVVVIGAIVLGITAAVHAGQRSSHRHAQQLAPLRTEVIEKSVRTVRETGAVVAISEVTDPSVLASEGLFERLSLGGHGKDLATSLAKHYHIDTQRLVDGQPSCVQVASGVRGCYADVTYKGAVSLFTFESAR